MQQLKAVIYGICLFLVSWSLLGFLAHFCCGIDPTGDPEVDKQHEGRSIMVGCSVILCSMSLGLLEYSIVRRRNKRITGNSARAVSEEGETSSRTSRPSSDQCDADSW